MPALHSLAANAPDICPCGRSEAWSRRFRQAALSCLATLCLAISPGAHAVEPYRCVVGGKVTITDTPCNDIGGSETPAAPPAVRPDAALVVPTAAGHTGRESNFMTISGGLALLLLGLALAAAFTGWRPARRENHREPIEPPPRTSGPDNENEKIPYIAASLMSAEETAFLYHLRGALPEFEVFPQVPLNAFVRIDRNRAGDDIFTNGYRWQNRISQQRVDFLVCHQADMSPLAAIKLHDPSHDNEDSRRRDRIMERSLQMAGVPLLCWPIEDQPDLGEIRRELGLEQAAPRRNHLPAILPGKRGDN